MQIRERWSDWVDRGIRYVWRLFSGRRDMELREQLEETVGYIRSKTDFKPELGVILGTGLGGLAEHVEREVVLPYEDIPNFPISTVETHAGRLILGRLEGKRVVMMQGRFHRYEGYTLKQVTFPVRVMRALGAGTLFVSNIAGGMNPNFRAGDLVVIVDHINLMGDNPLIGPNDDELGPRFPDMSEPYDRKLIALAEEVALREGIRLQRGVYIAVTGPSLETPAEYRFLRAIGADMVGMSTVPEVIVAKHMGMRVLGLTVISDECFPDALKPVHIQDLIRTVKGAEPKLVRLVRGIVAKI